MIFTEDVFYDAFKTVLTFVGGLLAAFIGQQAARRNAKASEKTAKLDLALRPLESANAAWERLMEPTLKRVDSLEHEVEELRKENHEREGILVQAITLLVTWGRWIESGAIPPPPSIPQWLRSHMVQAFKDIGHKEPDPDE